ncbi:MAG: sodium:solute symporter family protein [Sporomusaceae bacterium]|nr:sodium:solute symporter family protein [Sporomusaceae bacterium]
MLLSSTHLVSLALTLLLVSSIGAAAARKVKNANDFTLGGNSSGSVLVAGTIIGTIAGGSATIGTAQLAFVFGLSAWWFTLGAGVALLIMAAFYARPLRASALQTIPQFLTLHFGAAAGPIASAAASIGIFFSIVSNLLAATPLTAAILALDGIQALLLVLLLVICYVFFGGVWGTGLVGVVKTGLLFLSLGGVWLAAYDGMDGWSGYRAALPPFPWFSLAGRGVWVDAASGLSLIVGTLTTQTYIQALYAAKDEKTARNGALLAALVTLPTGIPAVMAGMYMRIHYPQIAPIDALPLFILGQLPPWLGGIALATLLLAAVGSAAGLALGVSAMVSRDIVAAKWRLSDAAMLRVNRLAVLFVTLLAALFCLGNLHSLVLEWNFLSMGLRGAGIFLPLTLAIFLPGRVGGPAAVASMLAGVAAVLIWRLVFPDFFDPLYAGLLSSLSALLLMQAKSQFRRRRAGSRSEGGTGK